MHTRGQLRLVPFPLVALAVAAGLHSAVVRSQTPGSTTTVSVNGHDAVAGEVLVRFADDAGGPRVQRILEERGDASENVAVGRRGIRRIRSRVHDVEQLLTVVRAQPGVLYAEPNYLWRADAVPDDPRFSELWGLLNVGQDMFGSIGSPGSDISAPSAWSHTTGSRLNVIGVIDSGIDYTHPDLAANVWSAPAPFTVMIGGVPITCPAGSHGYNAIVKGCDPMDTFSHGTHVAGSIGAIGNNGIGVAGVNWRASVIAAKFLDEGVGNTADAIDSIDFMIQVKAIFAASGGANIRVLNNSWGGGPFSAALRDTIAAAQASDILFVASAGNGARDIDVVPHYPASYDLPNIIAVAATTNRDRLWAASNYGAASVHLAAPGDFILSTVPGGTYSYRSGTSFAAPHVAGAAALVLSSCAYDTIALKSALLSAVDLVPALSDRVNTHGRLNVDRAVRSCVPDGIPPEPAGLVATPGDAQAALSWHSVGTAASYNVKRSQASGGPYVAIATGVTATHYVDTGLVNGTTYYYVVSATNAFGESENSLEASATPRLAPPPAPESLEALPGDARVALEWTAAPGADVYHVKRSLSRSGPYAPIAAVASPSFIDLTVSNGTKYFYVVSAENAAGEGKDSHKAAAVVAPPPEAPAGVTALPGADPRSIELSWSESQWATVYRVRRSTTSGGPYTGVRKVTSPSFTDSGLKSGRRYFYVITAVNDSGENTSIEVSAISR